MGRSLKWRWSVYALALLSLAVSSFLMSCGQQSARPDAKKEELAGKLLAEAQKEALSVSSAWNDDSRSAIETFLKKYNLQVTGAAEVFPITVPESWKVPLGGYPSGLYWGLANVLSEDAGLSLTSLKGKKVLVWRSELQGGLPGEGPSSQYRYPSDVILLLEGQKVVGGWLEFNRSSLGPSVRRRQLEEITGRSFEEWLKAEGYFTESGRNGDLAHLDPVKVIKAFLAAINEGDKTRANACLSPKGPALYFDNESGTEMSL